MRHSGMFGPRDWRNKMQRDEARYVRNLEIVKAYDRTLDTILRLPVTQDCPKEERL